ncbi:hypothetical protein [Clostridium sp.]|uniref:hypothetical protein n=1 Tax=Clostridium sp. TaxID=1506 RepID=UPI003994FC96
MRNLDFTISLFSLLLYFFTNRIHYICAMKSYDEDEKSHLYSKFSLISRIYGKISLMFFAYGMIRLTLSLSDATIIPYIIALLTILLTYLAGTKANEKLLNQAYEKITRLKNN